jgi:hypothetical protein
MFMVDRHQTLNLKEPIFAQLKYIQESYPTQSNYQGIGYKIIIEKDTEIISATMFMFDKVAAGAVADVNNKQSAFKGLELYIWKDNQELQFGILIGTNRAKNYEEIDELKNNPMSIDDIERELSAYEKDTDVDAISVDRDISEQELNDIKYELENNTECIIH